jgi:hypothetical protein
MPPLGWKRGDLPLPPTFTWFREPFSVRFSNRSVEAIRYAVRLRICFVGPLSLVQFGRAWRKSRRRAGIGVGEQARTAASAAPFPVPSLPSNGGCTKHLRWATKRSLTGQGFVKSFLSSLGEALDTSCARVLVADFYKSFFGLDSV